MSEETRKISQLLNERAEEFAIRLLGEPTKRSARELRFFPKQGLSVKISGAHAGQWKDFGKGEGGDMLSLFMYVRKGASFVDAIEAAKTFLGISHGGDLPEIDVDKIRAESARKAENEEKKRLRTASLIWDESVSLSEVPNALAYLRGRAVTADLSAFFRARHIPPGKLRYIGLDESEAAAFPNGLDALVCPAIDSAGELRAVQQIFLDGPVKANVPVKKMTNGVMLGAAVRLGPAPRETLVLAEGPETGASVFQATGMPTWIVLGTSNFTRIEIPSGVREILIALDREESGTGLAAALEAASFWRLKGYRVGIADPLEGDFNDVHRFRGEDAVRERFDWAAFAPDVAAGEAVFTRSAQSGLALWRATGAYVRAFPGGLRGSKTIVPEGTKRLTVVLDAARGSEDEEDLANALKGWTSSDAGIEIRILDLYDARADEDELFSRLPGLLARASTPDKRSPRGLPSLVSAPKTAPIVIVCDEAERPLATDVFGDVPVLASAGGEHPTDFGCVRDRDVVIVPRHDATGLAWSARAIATLREHGARKVWMLDWPTCRPGTGDRYEVAYSRLPVGYGLAQFHADGWRRVHLDVVGQWLKTVDVITTKTGAAKKPRPNVQQKRKAG